MRTISGKAVGRSRRQFRKFGSSSRLREIIAKLRDATTIPIGYQDKTGFHFGVELCPAGGGTRIPVRPGSGKREAKFERLPLCSSWHSRSVYGPGGTGPPARSGGRLARQEPDRPVQRGLRLRAQAALGWAFWNREERKAASSWRRSFGNSAVHVMRLPGCSGCSRLRTSACNA